jgi:hypothetical protein
MWSRINIFVSHHIIQNSIIISDVDNRSGREYKGRKFFCVNIVAFSGVVLSAVIYLFPLAIVDHPISEHLNTHKIKERQNLKLYVLLSRYIQFVNQ